MIIESVPSRPLTRARGKPRLLQVRAPVTDPYPSASPRTIHVRAREATLAAGPSAAASETRPAKAKPPRYGEILPQGAGIRKSAPAFENRGVLHRRTRLKLHDKLTALVSLGRHLGMFADRHVAEDSFEHMLLQVTPEERAAMARELIEEGKKYLPAYREVQAKLVRPSPRGRGSK